MVKKKDPLWEHGENLNDKFMCKYCQNTFSGGITRLKFHLSGLKGNDVEICTQVPDNVKAQAYLAVNKRSKNESSFTSVSEDFTAGSLSSRKRKTCTTSYDEEARHKELMKLLQQLKATQDSHGTQLTNLGIAVSSLAAQHQRTLDIMQHMFHSMFRYGPGEFTMDKSRFPPPAGFNSNQNPSVVTTTLAPDQSPPNSMSPPQRTTLSNPQSIPSSQPPNFPIQWPDSGTLTVDWIFNLISTFEYSSRKLPPTDLPKVLPVAVFDKLILTGSKLLHKEPNCVKIDDLGENSSVVVVGDVHGQFHDVLFLLKDAGYPSDNRVFVFNGDYVDRGAWGFETYVLLLAWKILYPTKVFLLRGNHESKYCTSIYGFEKEVMTKYCDQGKHVYRKCLGCFEDLPLATIIAGRVYTAHGGLFRSVTLAPSQKAKRKRKIDTNSEENSDDEKLLIGSFDELSKARRAGLDPPWQGTNLIPGDVLWSDPSMTPGLSPNSERGIGLLWGPDCTEEFMKKHDLKLIIRSHEGPDAREKRPDLGGMDQGYTIDHVVESGKLITLFSAPDYPQFQAKEERYKNKAAYIVLKPPNFDIPTFHSFEAVLPRPKANPFYDFEHVINSDEELDLAAMVPSPWAHDAVLGTL